MSLLLITDQGASVKKESRRIYVEKDDVELCEIQSRKINAVGIMGNAQISTQALALLADDEVPVTFLTMTGDVKGQFLPLGNKNLSLRYEQYRMCSDKHARLKLASYLVFQKISSYIDFYRRIQKNEPVEGMKQIIETFEKSAARALTAESVEQLLGIEGASAALHFNQYGRFFKNELRFYSRSKHPPLDEVNAMLSFGYAMLFKLINGILVASGLDPYSGCLHRNKYNRSGLTCDVQEIFRVNYIDAMVLRLCNLGMIKSRHFESGEYGISFTKEGIGIFLKEWRDIAYATINAKLVKEIQAETEKIIRAVKEYGASVCEDTCAVDCV